MQKLFICLLFSFLVICPALGGTAELLNVSYDPTRELYKEINKLFTREHQNVEINQSHGGSGKQARSILYGLRADVATLAIANDIDMLAENGLVNEDWRLKLPNNSSPYRSTIVFLVKKDNPKKIQDWDDLVKDGIVVITPNPKISGGAIWNYIAAWGFAMEKYHDEEKAKAFMKKLFRNVPLLDTSARAATITFAKRGIGDVLLAWENEAMLVVNKLDKGKFDIIMPSVSVEVNLPVAVVESVTKKKVTTELAYEYLGFLFSEEAQNIIAKHYYRPTNLAIYSRYQYLFPDIKMIKLSDVGEWKEFKKKHFTEGGLFDQLYR
jgi:sulfate/thiosulfate transport system substrate-binding protein